MCCPFIVSLMIGVSNKAYSDTCGCLLNEFQVTLLSKQPQEHICNHRVELLGCCWAKHSLKTQNEYSNMSLNKWSSETLKYKPNLFFLVIHDHTMFAMCNSSLLLHPMVCVCLLSAGCYKITTVFSHAQTVVLCVGCSTVLCQPTGGKARLTEGTGKTNKQTSMHREEMVLPVFNESPIVFTLL